MLDTSGIQCSGQLAGSLRHTAICKTYIDMKLGVFNHNAASVKCWLIERKFVWLNGLSHRCFLERSYVTIKILTGINLQRQKHCNDFYEGLFSISRFRRLVQDLREYDKFPTKANKI